MRKRSLRFGAVLIYCLLLIALIGKSHLLHFSNNVWRLQMATVVITVSIGILYVVLKPSKGSWGWLNNTLPLRVKICLVILLYLSIISCVAQENPIGNILFLFVFTGMVYLLFVNGTELTRGISKNRCIDLALLPLCIMLMGSLHLIVLHSQERFFGLYFGAIIAGQMFGLTCLLLFWKVVHTQSKKVWIYLALFPVAILCLLLTRTRTDILGAAAGMTVCLAAAMVGGTMSVSKQRAWIILVFLLLFLLLAVALIAQPSNTIDRTREYLRLSGDYDDILRSRLEVWQTGTDNLSINNIFGKGPIARFGGQLSTQDSGYVRELSSCNSYLAVFQAYGWPGGILFIIFLIAVGSIFLSRRDPYATLGLSLFVFGLVNSISENWLLSFGNPLDIYSWFILGLTLTHNSSNRRLLNCDNRC